MKLLILILINLKEIIGLSLNTYNVDKSKITVSGISSGAAMANQLHVAYSSVFSGVGIVAGPPYTCSDGSALLSVNQCMLGIGYISLSSIHNTVSNYQSSGKIDSVLNMKNDKIYIYHGVLDVIVSAISVKKNEDFYTNYVTNPLANIKTVYNMASVHGFITNDYGYTCSVINLFNYLNNCNYNQAYEILNHMYGPGLQEPVKGSKAAQALIEFDQTEFFNGQSQSTVSMASTGYIYVPQNCRNNANCKLHIALHGCGMAGRDFPTYAGYNQVADLNDIIIVYPQVRSSLTSNPQGCWDWWGYTNINYANKFGPQMITIRNMISRLTA